VATSVPANSTTVEPTKEEVTIEMDGCIDSDRVVSSTKKLPSRSVKKRVVYFAKSNSELGSDEDGNKAPKKRSFKKKANATNNDKFKLGPHQAPYRTPPAHLHQSPICRRGRRNRGHHNANRAGRRIGVAMSTWSLCRSPQARC
jgi:hypothetical protein